MNRHTLTGIAGVAGALAALLGACDTKSSAPSKPSNSGKTSSASDINAADTYQAVNSTLGPELLAAAGGDSPAPALLKQHAKDIERLVDATRLPTCDFGVDYAAGLNAVMPHLAMVRGLTRVLKADAARLLAGGDLDGAARRIAAIERLAAHVLRPAHSIIELLVATAVARVGAGFVNEHAALAGAPWKTDIQQSLVDLEQELSRTSAVIARDSETMVKALREGKMLDLGAVGGRNWTTASQAERDAAAAKLEAMYADVAKAWNAPGGVARLATLEQQAADSGVGDLFPPLSKARKSVDDLLAEIAKANTTLGG